MTSSIDRTLAMALAAAVGGSGGMLEASEPGPPGSASLSHIFI